MSIARAKGRRLSDEFGTGGSADDDFDQQHLRHRIEEVHTDQPPGIGERRGDAFQWNARRIGRQQCCRLRAGFQRRKESSLGLEILEYRFDDHIGARNAVTGDIRKRKRSGARRGCASGP